MAPELQLVIQSISEEFKDGFNSNIVYFCWTVVILTKFDDTIKNIEPTMVAENDNSCIAWW